MGRRLESVRKGNARISYKYNADGLRTSKTIRNVKFNYYWNGDKLTAQTNGDNNKWYFRYDGDTPISFEFNGKEYYYVTNLQGDIIAILDSTGNCVAEYSYDAWGNCTVEKDTNTIAYINPLRYRGYYYDSDTNLYYLQSRYYDSKTGRFVNADEPSMANQGVLNLFAYCRNNPIMSVDPNGYYDISKFNCYAYAMGISNKWLHPGKGIVNVRNKNGSLKNRKYLMPNYYSLKQLRKWVLKDFGKKVRVLSGKNDKLKKGEYRVAMRVAIYTRPLPIQVGGPVVWSTYDFHFWKQDPKTGIWWDKPGPGPIRKKGKVNPDNKKYWEYKIEGFYTPKHSFNSTDFSLGVNQFGYYIWYRQLYYNSKTLYIAYKGDFWKK